MTTKEIFFQAFASLEKRGVKLWDITWGQMEKEVGGYFVGRIGRNNRHLFYQYRYLYRKEAKR